MGILNRDQIRQKQDLPTEVVPVPEWEGDVIVRGMTAGQRVELAAKTAEFKGVDLEADADPAMAMRMLQVQVEVVCCALVDEQGQYLFTIEEDAGWLKDKHPAVLRRLFETTLRLSGMNVGAVEEAAKNS